MMLKTNKTRNFTNFIYNFILLGDIKLNSEQKLLK